MDENVLIRAITIGASVFITLVTVTAVFMYYNVAKEQANSIGAGIDIEANYRDDIKTILYKAEITGSDLKNILQYFYKNPDIHITVNSYYGFYENGFQLVWIPIGDRANINQGNSDAYIQLMKNIMPNQKFKLLSDMNTNTYTFDVYSK